MGQIIHPFEKLSSLMTALGVSHADGIIRAQNHTGIHNSVGTPHGGFISSLLNAAAMEEIRGNCMVEQAVSSVDCDLRAELSSLNVSYLSVAKPDQEMVVSSKLLHATPSDAVVRSVLNADGKMLAEARLHYRFTRLSGGQGPFVHTGAYEAATIAPNLLESSGLEAVQDAAAKNMPPYMDALGIQFEDVELGRVSLVMPELNPDFAERDGSIDPSLIVSMADSLGLAGRTVIDGGRYTMSGLEVHVFDPLKSHDMPLRVVGTVTKPGAKNVVVQADVVDRNDNLKATATLGCMPLPKAAYG